MRNQYTNREGESLAGQHTLLTQLKNSPSTITESNSTNLLKPVFCFQGSGNTRYLRKPLHFTVATKECRKVKTFPFLRIIHRLRRDDLAFKAAGMTGWSTVGDCKLFHLDRGLQVWQKHCCVGFFGIMIGQYTSVGQRPTVHVMNCYHAQRLIS